MKKLVLLVLLLFVLVSCGTVNVAIKPNTTFTKQGTITVVVESTDPIGVQGNLEHLLLEKGFEVVSQVVAEEKVKLQSESEGGVLAKGKSNEDQYTAVVVGKSLSEQAVSRIRELKSTYILRFKYHSYWDVFYWAFTTFNATVVDLRTGEVVASVNFSGDRSANSVLEEFINKLTATIK
ncbi:hypothetical protein KKC52_08800 [bacterium]|nr:hypothetical protein [bacterium]MBU1397689.1 hypothetical protein [Pseudomonadota bacterium]